MQEPTRCIPLIFDYVEMRLRIQTVNPGKGEPDGMRAAAGISLPLLRIQ